jgi:prepilin-type N-terminal cleavage/methylation domain-containing protein
MRKMLKGFTLIELIVVMAILVIMMAAIMKFFEPIRQVYNDATFYEQRRSVTNSMVKYTTESIRYAKYIGILNQTGIGTRSLTPELTAVQAASNFRSQLQAAGGTVPPTGATINVIELSYYNDYNGAGDYNGNQYMGRLYRTKLTAGVPAIPATPGNPGATPPIPPTPGVPGTPDTVQNCHLAFGQNYYGPNDYNMQWAYAGGKFEAYASSYSQDDFNDDGIVVRSVAAVVLKNVNIDGKVVFTDGNTDSVPDILAGSLTTTGTNINYGGMSAAAPTSYYLVWVDADQYL